jgi:hypothetical protein
MPVDPANSDKTRPVSVVARPAAIARAQYDTLRSPMTRGVIEGE